MRKYVNLFTRNRLNSPQIIISSIYWTRSLLIIIIDFH